LVIKYVALTYGDGVVDVHALPGKHQLPKQPQAGLLAAFEFVSHVRWWRAQTMAQSYGTAMDFEISRRDGAGQISSRSFALFGRRLKGKAPIAPCCEFVAPAGEEIVGLRFANVNKVNCLKSVSTLRTVRAGGDVASAEVASAHAMPSQVKVLKRTLPEVVAVSTEFGTAWYAQMPDMRLSADSVSAHWHAIEVPPPFGRPNRPHVHYWLVKIPSSCTPGTLLYFLYPRPLAPAANADAQPAQQRMWSMVVPENAPEHRIGTLFVVPIDRQNGRRRGC
jgi:hypothetical protein